MRFDLFFACESKEQLETDDSRFWVKKKKKKQQRILADLSVNRVIIVAGLWPCILFPKTLNEL